MPSRVLVTGAAGGVASLLLAGLAEAYDLRLTDRRPVSTPVDGAETVLGDLTDPAFAAAVTDGVDAIVHLAASADPQAGWDALLGPNVHAVTNLLEAAVRSRVGRVVLAGSAHITGQYVRGSDRPIRPEWPPAPCCAYGVTKAMAEAAARMYAYRNRLSTVCLRLGATTATPPVRSALDSWLAPDDLRQLVTRALGADVGFGVYFGTSANTRSVWDLGNAARELGYQPVRDSEAYADTVPDDEDWGPCPPAG